VVAAFIAIALKVEILASIGGAVLSIVIAVEQWRLIARVPAWQPAQPLIERTPQASEKG